MKRIKWIFSSIIFAIFFIPSLVFAEGTETKAVYKEKEISLNRLKTGKRDTSGVKQRA